MENSTGPVAAQQAANEQYRRVMGPPTLQAPETHEHDCSLELVIGLTIDELAIIHEDAHA